MSLLGSLSAEARAELEALIKELVAAEVARRLADNGDAGDFMDIVAAAAYLGVTVERLRKLKARGEIPYYQDGPNCRVHFRRVELDEWMAAKRRGLA